MTAAGAGAGPLCSVPGRLREPCWQRAGGSAREGAAGGRPAPPPAGWHRGWALRPPALQ